MKRLLNVLMFVLCVIAIVLPIILVVLSNNSAWLMAYIASPVAIYQINYFIEKPACKTENI